MCEMEGINLGKTNQKKKIIDILLSHMLPSPQSKEYLESTASLEEEESGDDGDDPNDEDYDDDKDRNNNPFDNRTWVAAKSRSGMKKKSRSDSPLTQRKIKFESIGSEKRKISSSSTPSSATNSNKKTKPSPRKFSGHSGFQTAVKKTLSDWDRIFKDGQGKNSK